MVRFYATHSVEDILVRNNPVTRIRFLNPLAAQRFLLKPKPAGHPWICHLTVECATGWPSLPQVSEMTLSPCLKILCVNARLGCLLILLGPRLVRAEDAINYKYADYRESGGRIAVQTQSALIEQDFGTEMHLKLEGTIDAITGATPNGQPAPAGSDQVVLTNLHDQRKAWKVDFSHQFPALNVALGVANSRESDYISNGWSVNTLADFNQKNTTLLAGIAGTEDKVKVIYQSPWARKRTNDVIVGVTQLLDPRTSVSFDLTWGRATGYLSDQYKIVQKRIEVNPGDFLPLQFLENRPGVRDKWIALGSLNHAFPDLHGALEASYRFYHDTYGTRAHTLELTWLQQISPTLILRPELRFYDQSAADFYYYQLDQTSIVPPFGPPPKQGPFYSSDFRVSALRTFNYGLKIVWTPTARWQLNAALEEYAMHGKDGVTPRSAYPRATIVTAGLKISW